MGTGEDEHGAVALQRDETALSQRARDGDRRAFAELVRLHQTPVYRLCLRYLRGPDAEDATQDTFLRAFAHRGRLDPGRPLLPWLLTIARRLCIDRLRKKTPEPDSQRANTTVDARPNAEQLASSREQLARLGAALATLPEGPREAVALFHFESMPYQQIATALDVPTGTVMTWLHRGRARLRAALKEAEPHVEHETQELRRRVSP